MVKEPIFWPYHKSEINFNEDLNLWYEGVIKNEDCRWIEPEFDSYPIIKELAETNNKNLALLNLRSDKYEIFNKRLIYMCKEILFNDNKFIINKVDE
jgi:hypothetical protein